MFFSTRAIDAADRRAAWLSTTKDLFGSFKIDFSPGVIDGSVEARRVGEFNGQRICHPQSQVYRTSREIGCADPRRYAILLQLSGRSEVEQVGRQLTMLPGNATILDTNMPVAFTFDRKSYNFVLYVPKERLDGRGVDWWAHLATGCPAATASIVQSMVLASFEQPMAIGLRQSQAASEAILSIFSTGYLDSEDGAAEDDLRAVPNLLKSVQAYIVNQMQNETLSPSIIAKAHNISERQLHRLFEPLGLSVCRWIRQARLDRCAMDLRDAAQRDKTITQIAFGRGFNDSAHFSRSFREEFNQTPREYRASACAVMSGATRLT